MTESYPDILYKIAFSQLKGMRPMLAEQILGKVGSERQFFNLTTAQIGALYGKSNAIYTESHRRDVIEKAKRELEFVDKHRIKTIYFTDLQYPERLRQCDDAPMMLYGMGTCDLNATPVISIVGTRHATAYGVGFVERLVEDLAKRLVNPPIIVSGLAYGIDITAHRAALKNEIPTVAIVAHGLSTVYPVTHRLEASRIARGGGMILTEYMSKAPVHRGNFLARNRIVAGIADCVIVAESAKKGGAMVTAHLAREYNREVLALPGRCTDAYSEGCNKLIRNNVAALIDGADSLIDMMGWQCRPTEGEQTTIEFELPPDKLEIIEHLRANGEGRLNAMSVTLNRPISRLMADLVELEFKGLIRSLPGGLYTLM